LAERQCCVPPCVQPSLTLLVDRLKTEIAALKAEIAFLKGESGEDSALTPEDRAGLLATAQAWVRSPDDAPFDIGALTVSTLSPFYVKVAASAGGVRGVGCAERGEVGGGGGGGGGEGGRGRVVAGRGGVCTVGAGGAVVFDCSWPDPATPLPSPVPVGPLLPGCRPDGS
jgi:hypothetical protein